MATMELCRSVSPERVEGATEVEVSRNAYIIVHSFPRFSQDTWDLLVVVRLLPFVFQLGLVV